MKTENLQRARELAKEMEFLQTVKATLDVAVAMRFKSHPDDPFEQEYRMSEDPKLGITSEHVKEWEKKLKNFVISRIEEKICEVLAEAKEL